MGYGNSKGVHLISDNGVFRGLGTAFATMVRADLPDDVMKALVAGYIASLKELEARPPFAANVNYDVLNKDVSGFCGPMTLKYHPVAIAAWEEAGHAVPDCAK